MWEAIEGRQVLSTGWGGSGGEIDCKEGDRRARDGEVDMAMSKWGEKEKEVLMIRWVAIAGGLEEVRLTIKRPDVVCTTFMNYGKSSRWEVILCDALQIIDRQFDAKERAINFTSDIKITDIRRWLLLKAFHFLFHHVLSRL